MVLLGIMTRFKCKFERAEHDITFQSQCPTFLVDFEYCRARIHVVAKFEIFALVEEHASGVKGQLPDRQSQFDGELGEEVELREAGGILRRCHVCSVERSREIHDWRVLKLNYSFEVMFFGREDTNVEMDRCKGVVAAAP